MVVTLHPIYPKRFTASPEELQGVIQETIDEAERQFARTYRTFTHKPSFIKDITANDKQVEGSILTSGDGSAENPYPFVAKGTRVRYAQMTPNFVSKTTPNVLYSHQGRGGVLRINKNKPLPGIESRRFEEEIIRIQSKRIKTRLNRAIGRYVKKSGHAI